MKKLNLSFLTVNSAKSFAFYMLPKELFKNELFDGIDINSKVLYGFMLDRASLSATNPDFIDENGNVYIIYTVEQVKVDLRCSNDTAMKMLKQLEESGLIQRRIRGQGKAAITYVMDFSTAKLSTTSTTEFKDSEKQNSEKWNSRTPKNRKQGLQKSECNHTNQNHTDWSHTDSIDSADPVDNSDNFTSDFDVGFADKEKKEDVPNSGNASHNPNPTNYYLNIDYLKIKYPDKRETLGEIAHLISEVFRGREQMFRIGKQNVEAYHVRSALSKIDNRHVEYVINSMKKDKKDIKSYKNYLLTALYNSAKQTFIDVDTVKSVVRKNINLDGLLNHYPDKRKEIQEIYGIIIETLVTQKQFFRIARGELPSELVKQSFADISEKHIHYVMDSLRKNTSEVKSAKAFLQTCLWNSTKTVSNHLSLDVRRFLYEHLGIEPK